LEKIDMFKKTVLLTFLIWCSFAYAADDVNRTVLNSLKQLSSTVGFKPYEDNPVLRTGPEGSWDAGALGSMSVLKVGDVFHMYYESWGVRSEKEWDAIEYESLQIGHATFRDGVHWTKDPQNPALPQGAEGEWDGTGTWDPYVIYEDGLYKMWYGGGGGRKPNFGWAYAVSKDGTQFEKKGLTGKGNLSGVEDCHVIHDTDSGLYYMYYWYGRREPNALYCVISPTETAFDFDKAINIKIEGDDSFMKKFVHVLKDKEGWHMFYSNFVQPHCPNSIVRYAFSNDGIHWQAKNKNLIKGHDAEVIPVTDDLYLMYYNPQNHFDAKDCDIRLAVYNGRLPNLSSTLPLNNELESNSLIGKTLTARAGEDMPTTWAFREDGEVILSGGGASNTFNAYYEQDGKNVYIKGEGIELEATYDEELLTFGERGKSMSIETKLVPSPARYSLLLPPGYESGDKTYPLLFWLHGGGGHDGHLEGTAPLFKKMWKEGTLSELVVVTPHAARYPANYMDFKDGSQRWESFITGELLAHLRAKYRVAKDRSGTFISGISMGGFGSLMMGLKHLDTFGAIVAFEPQIVPAYDWKDGMEDEPGPRFGNPIDKTYWVANNPAAIIRDNVDAVKASGIKIYIEVGSEDVFRFDRGTHFLHRALYERGIRHEYRFVYGADHVGTSLTWRYRDGLVFLNRIINPPPPDPEVERFRNLFR
jgi:S-formylglutathione hydrolase